MDDDSVLSDIGDMFPESERPPTPPSTSETYARDLDGSEFGDQRGPRSVEIHLVGHHPLWGHHLWNSSKVFASFLDKHWEELCRHRRILELGAGGALPGICAALNQASAVMLTDYPDSGLIRNIELNVQTNLCGKSLESTRGFIWGSQPSDLLHDGRFDVLLLSDLLFNHSQHDALLRTCEQTLTARRTEDTMAPCALVFFTHHRPWLAEKDMQFFEKAKRAGWECEQVVQIYTGAMFADDKGDEIVRGTVHGWRLWRADGATGTSMS